MCRLLLALLVLVAALALPGLCRAAAAPTCNALGTLVDCHIDTQGACEAAGCCWAPNAFAQPYCFQANAPVSTYTANAASPSATSATLTAVRNTSLFGADIGTLALTITCDSAAQLHVKFVDAQQARYEVPEWLLPRGGGGYSPDSPPRRPARQASCGPFSWTISNEPFALAIARGGQTIWNSTTDVAGGFLANGLVFEDQYIEFSTQLPVDANLYGLGEHVDRLRLRPDGSMVYSMWNVDNPNTPLQNLYGTHPFYMELRDGQAYGVFMMNSNAQEIRPFPGGLTWRFTGGVLDMYLFAGPDPESVLQQYHTLIGFPALPPYWALGFHQCRYGWPSLSYTEEVVANFSANNLPLDTIWEDIQYMDSYEDFTFDPVNFPLSDMQQFADTLHANSQHFVVIVDPGIHNRSGYYPMQAGLQTDVFIKQADGSVFQGKVWPGLTFFPDFLNNDVTGPYWTKMIGDFLSQVPFDGLWIDMNEISNFCTGECSSKKKRGVNDVNNPPYQIVNYGSYNNALNTKTLDMDCTHVDGQYLEYDVHNLYGFTEAVATRTALTAYYPGKRPFVLSRSTYAGSGKHTAHWTGDNYSTFQSMAASIPGILSMNMFGIPLVGSDICGFQGSTTEELCARWMALGAFYPFSRNHNVPPPVPPQEPYRWPSVANATRVAMGARYSLLPYYYTLFAAAAAQGGSVARPLFFEWPSDSNTFDLDTQFLIGPALLISPVLNESVTTVDAYLPSPDNWYDFWTGAPMTSNGWQTLQAPLEYINVHVRGGYILPMQQPALTTATTRANPMRLLVALNSAGSASGSLTWDDGATTSTAQLVVQYSVANSRLSATTASQAYASGLSYDQVTVLGVSAAPAQGAVTVNGAPLASAQVSYNSATQVLLLSGLSAPVDSPLTVAW